MSTERTGGRALTRWSGGQGGNDADSHVDGGGKGMDSRVDGRTGPRRRRWADMQSGPLERRRRVKWIGGLGGRGERGVVGRTGRTSGLAVWRTGRTDGWADKGMGLGLKGAIPLTPFHSWAPSPLALSERECVGCLGVQWGPRGFPVKYPYLAPRLTCLI